MKTFKLILLTAASLLVCQLGWAQGRAVPLAIPGEKSVAETAAAAQAVGMALPVIPRHLATPGTARPPLWVLKQLTAPASPPFKLLGTPPYAPYDLVTAYGVNQILRANGGAGMTIAIVDAYHYTGVEADLNVFSSVYGLPPCTTANGCFKQVAQVAGCATPPRAGSDSGWELETMLDVEWAHAMAPNAKIVLVEGDDNSYKNLLTAVATAEGCADILSNSWLSDEFPEEVLVDPVFNVSKPILFSSGDSSAPATYPCSSPYVTCIGGTSLYLNAASQRTSETGWSGSGGGCSAFEPSQSWQINNGVTLCVESGSRAVPDVSADADPNTGVAVFDYGNGGWYQVGGTSLSSPLMAGIYANVMTARISFGKSKFGFMNPSLYQPAAPNGGNPGTSRYTYMYFDVVSGFNGYPAGPGYDLVTGLGVLKGPAMANKFFGLVYP